MPINTDKTVIRQRLELARRLLLEAAEHIDEKTAIASTENRAWNVRDILSHVAASENGMLRTIERFRAGGALPEGFSLEVWNQRQVQKRAEKSIDDLIAELQASRQAAWAMLDPLADPDLSLPGTHPAGFPTTVAGIFHTIANHELDHGNEIRAALGLPITEKADWQQSMAS